MDQSKTFQVRAIIGGRREFRLAVLVLVWVLAGLLVSVIRLSHPAFGIQGDLPLHYQITRSYAQSFAEGDVLPRWAGLLDGGRGDALFTFYPPLSYLLSALLIKLSGIDVLTSLKVVSLFMLILAQAGAYLFAREFFSRRQSLIVSVSYVLLPAYPLVALHRAFFANALALSLAPLALLGAHLLLCGRRPGRGFAIFAFSFSAIVLTHAITTYLSALAIGLMTLVYLREVGWRGLIRLACAGLATAAMTAFFLVPQIVERDWVQIGLQIVQQDYRNYLLFARASDSSRYRKAWADVNFFTSLITLAQTILALLLWFLCRGVAASRPRDSRLHLVARFSLAVAAFGLLISLPVSGLVWRFLPGLKFIQFPWRFQPFVALGCGLLAAASLDRWPRLGRSARTLIAAVLTWVVIANLIFTVMLALLNEPGISRDQVAGWLRSTGASPVTIDEGRRLQNEDDLKYLPYTANQIYFRPPGSDFNLYPPAEQPGGLSMVSGRGRVVSQRLGIEHREFKVENEEAVQARIDTYAYPHWVARLDGQKQRITTEAGSGLMLIELPAGNHRLTLDYEVGVIPERIAGMVSIAAWLSFCAWILMITLRAVMRRDYFKTEHDGI